MAVLFLTIATLGEARAQNDTAAEPKPMATDADPAFAIASIKLSAPDSHDKRIIYGRGGSRLTAHNESVSDLLTFTFGLHPAQIAGGPAWITTERYDIMAEPDRDGIPSDRQWRSMLSKLLADRFRLKFHRMSKLMSVYVIARAATPLKLTPNTTVHDGLYGFIFPALGSVNGSNATMEDFAGLLQTSVLDKPVVDRTGLTGRYNFTLDWKADEAQFTNFGIELPMPKDNDTRTDIFSAFRRQLGLTLKSGRASVGIVVIDHVDRPSEN